MDKVKIAQELVKLAKELMATEFESEEALKKYLKEHPDADKSKHTVKKPGGGGSKEQQEEKTSLSQFKSFDEATSAMRKLNKGISGIRRGDPHSRFQAKYEAPRADIYFDINSETGKISWRQYEVRWSGGDSSMKQVGEGTIGFGEIKGKLKEFAKKYKKRRR